jgi:hypothetical protein
VHCVVQKYLYWSTAVLVHSNKQFEHSVQTNECAAWLLTVLLLVPWLEDGRMVGRDSRR